MDCMLGRDWAANMISFTRTASRKKEWKESHQPMTKGEMILRFGEEEVEAGIRNKKWQEGEDSDGDAIYLVPSKKFSAVRSESQEVRQTRTCCCCCCCCCC